MERSKVVIIGAKNPEIGRMIAAIADEERMAYNGSNTGSEFIGFVDNDPARRGRFCDLPIFGGFEKLDELIAQGVQFVNTITGSTVARYETSLEVYRRGGRFTNLIHPNAGHFDEIGVGNYIQDGVIIQAGTKIEDNSSIHVGAVIAHESRIGSSTFIAHCVSVSGEVTVGDGVFIGTNATIAPRVNIGNWATVGAGAVVLRDVPDYAVVVGNPARLLKTVEKRYFDGKIKF